MHAEPPSASFLKVRPIGGGPVNGVVIRQHGHGRRSVVFAQIADSHGADRSHSARRATPSNASACWLYRTSFRSKNTTLHQSAGDLQCNVRRASNGQRDTAPASLHAVRRPKVFPFHLSARSSWVANQRITNRWTRSGQSLGRSASFPSFQFSRRSTSFSFCPPGQLSRYLLQIDTTRSHVSTSNMPM